MFRLCRAREKASKSDISIRSKETGSAASFVDADPTLEVTFPLHVTTNDMYRPL
jgi:hypothetical protein